mmetsp:Transcript_5712/g.16316  ORF Transcript_5712/g.16316 Transcript_5712/m.16316 type:complete len:217 (-) Transcript_5712:381-1031(-)
MRQLLTVARTVSAGTPILQGIANVAHNHLSDHKRHSRAEALGSYISSKQCPAGFMYAVRHTFNTTEWCHHCCVANELCQSSISLSKLLLPWCTCALLRAGIPDGSTALPHNQMRGRALITTASSTYHPRTEPPNPHPHPGVRMCVCVWGEGGGMQGAGQHYRCHCGSRAVCSRTLASVQTGPWHPDLLRTMLQTRGNAQDLHIPPTNNPARHIYLH